MSDFGHLEASVVEDSAPDVQKRVAAKQLQAAIFDVREVYGRFLLGASGLDEFEDRWHYSKSDVRKTVEPHVLPVTGVMRRIHDAMKREWKEAALYKGAPFAGYKDFAACVAANQDKGDPDAYCGSIKHKVEDKKSSRVAALDDAVDQHLEQTDRHSDADLIPEDNFEGYLDSVDQGGPEKVEHNFHRTDENDWDKTGAVERMALNLYTDWARSNHLRVASHDTLQLYSANCSDDEYRVIDAAIRRTAEEDDDEERVEEDKERLKEDEEREDEDEEEGDEDEDGEEGEGDDERDKDKKSDEDDDDDKGGPPWLTSNIRVAKPGDPGTYDPATGRDRPGGTPSPFEELFNPTQHYDPVTGRDVPNALPAPNAGNGNGGLPQAPTGVGGMPIGPDLGSQAAHHGVGGGYSGPGDANRALGTGGGYGGAGYQQNNKDWEKSTETSGIAGGGDYTVKPGETLGDIASRAGVDVSTLKTQSGDPNLITPGEKITIGQSSGNSSSSGSTPAQSATTSGTVNESNATSGSGGSPSSTSIVGDSAPAPSAAASHSGGGGDPALSLVGKPEGVTEGTVIQSGSPGSPRAASRLSSYFRQYYGTSRLAAEEDEGGGGEPPPQDPSAAPPAPGSEQAPQAPPSDQPPVDPSQQPAPMENQPAEDHLLDTAGQAVSQMIDRETQEYQQIIDPLTQAMQAIQYAQQVEQQSNPIDVTPPQGTVDVGPQDAATGAPAGATPPGAPQQPPQQPMQQQAYRIARHFGMTPDGYHMLLEAMGRKHYQVVADAIAGLRDPRERTQIAASLGDMFAEENPNFRHEPFFRAAQVPQMRTAGGDRCSECGGKDSEHAHYCSKGGDSAHRNSSRHEAGDYGLPGYFNRDTGYASELAYPQSPEEAKHQYLRDLMEEGPPGAPGRERTPWEEQPEDEWGRYSNRGRLGFNQQGAAPTLVPQQTLDTFKFPGTGKQTHPDDNLSITPDMTDLTPTKKAAFEAKVMDQWTKWDQGRAQQGLPELPAEDKVKSFANETGVGSRGVNTVMKNLGVPKAPKVPAGTAAPPKAAPKVKAGSSFFTRRVPGWTWNDHLAAYTASSPAPFTCHCGSMFDVPSYYSCRCGKVFNAYPIGSPGDDEGRTASVDQYLCREINVRDGMMMESSVKTACDECGHSPCACDTDWVTDEDREDADAPHAPYKNAAAAPRQGDPAKDYSSTTNRFQKWQEEHPEGSVEDFQRSLQEENPLGPKHAAIGEDDHSVVYRDGNRFCSKCDALLWDPNVHHCPAKQATRTMFGEMKSKDDRDDEPTTEGKDEDDKASTLSKGMKHKVKEHEGTSGEEVEEHVKGKKATRTMFGDWTVYDDGLGGGSRKPPSTVVSRPPEDWARRMPEEGPSSQWRPPIFRH